MFYNIECCTAQSSRYFTVLNRKIIHEVIVMHWNHNVFTFLPSSRQLHSNSQFNLLFYWLKNEFFRFSNNSLFLSHLWIFFFNSFYSTYSPTILYFKAVYKIDKILYQIHSKMAVRFFRFSIDITKNIFYEIYKSNMEIQ